MNVPLKTPPLKPPQGDKPNSTSPESHPSLIQVGSLRLMGKGLVFAMASLLIAVLAVIALVKWIWGIALGFLQVLLVAVKIGAIAFSGIVLVLIGVGAVRRIRAHREDRDAERQLLQGCPIPRAAVVRGEEAARSYAERILAAIVCHALIEQYRRDPQSLTDFEVAEFLLELPVLLRQPVYRSILERDIIQPCYRLLVVGNPFLVEQIERYGQLRQRAPFWELRRFVHVLTRGHLGLSREAVWQRQDISALRADYQVFFPWFLRFGMALLSRLEPLLEDEVLRVQAGRGANPALASGSEPSAQDEVRANKLVEGVGGVLVAEEPWSDPHEVVDELAGALDEVGVLNPDHPELAALTEQVGRMQARVDGFEADYARALELPEEQCPVWLNDAYRISANRLDHLRGHAARLYLTREPPDEESSGEPADASHFAGDPQTDSCPCSDSGAEPDESTQAHHLF